MSISVSELFLLDEFSDAKILAGSDGLEKNVYYVSILSSRENLQSKKYMILPLFMIVHCFQMKSSFMI